MNYVALQTQVNNLKRKGGSILTGFLIKLIVCPVTIIICELIFDGVSFKSIFHPIIIGLVLAFGAHLMEVFLLKRETFWLNNIVDFIAALIIVYISQFIFPNAIVTLNGAILSAALLSITEYYQHRYLIHTARIIKS